MKTADDLTDAERRSVALFLERIRKRYPVREALVYGSRARGEARNDSDLDLAVILDGAKGRASATAFDMAGDEFDVLLETGVVISALPVWTEDWDEPSRHTNPRLIQNMKRDGIRM